MRNSTDYIAASGAISVSFGTMFNMVNQGLALVSLGLGIWLAVVRLRSYYEEKNRKTARQKRRQQDRKTVHENSSPDGGLFY